MVFKRKDVIEAGYFNPQIRSGDTYLQLKIGQSKPAVVVPQGLTWWRRRRGNATEKLFQDNRYLAESFGYRLELLGENCPLTTHEIERAKVNLYGLYLRSLFRLIIRLKFGEVSYLWKKLKVPKSYVKSVFVPAQVNMFDDITGDAPLHTSSNSKATV